MRRRRHSCPDEGLAPSKRHLSSAFNVPRCFIAQAFLQHAQAACRKHSRTFLAGTSFAAWTWPGPEPLCSAPFPSVPAGQDERHHSQDSRTSRSWSIGKARRLWGQSCMHSQHERCCHPASCLQDLLCLLPGIRRLLACLDSLEDAGSSAQTQAQACARIRARVGMQGFCNGLQNETQRMPHSRRFRLHWCRTA